MLPYTFQRIMMTELGMAGYNGAEVVPGHHIQPVPDLPITVTDTRIVIPKDFPLTPAVVKIKKDLQCLLGISGEATWLFDNTPDSRLKGLAGQKLFAQYMNAMLTARFTDQGEPQYSVQTKEYDGSLTSNRKTGSYMDAKLHFLVLSPMQKNIPAFSIKYMDQVYQALLYRGQHDTEMRPLENEILQDAISAIERTFPGFADRRNRVEPEAGLEAEQ